MYLCGGSGELGFICVAGELHQCTAKAIFLYMLFFIFLSCHRICAAVVSCDHVGLVPVLVGSGADGSITDADGDTAASGADSSAMRTALEAVGL